MRVDPADGQVLTRWSIDHQQYFDMSFVEKTGEALFAFACNTLRMVDIWRPDGELSIRRRQDILSIDHYYCSLVKQVGLSRDWLAAGSNLQQVAIMISKN
jgi:hypothetical protein